MEVVVFWEKGVPDSYESKERFTGVDTVDIQSYRNNDILIIKHDNEVVRNIVLDYLVGWRIVK